MHIKGRERVTSPERPKSSSPPFVAPPRREAADTGSDAGSVDRVADGWRDGGKMNEEKKEIGAGLPGCGESSRRTRNLFTGGDGGSGEGFVCACMRVKMEMIRSSCPVIRSSIFPAAETFSQSPHMFTLPAMLPLHLPPRARARRYNDAEWWGGWGTAKAAPRCQSLTSIVVLSIKVCLFFMLCSYFMNVFFSCVMSSSKEKQSDVTQRCLTAFESSLWLILAVFQDARWTA